MEREIQVISPGALGNAMQPGQLPPPPSLCKMGNFGGGNGHRPAPGPPAAPSIIRMQKDPKPVPCHGAHGVPWLRDGWELGGLGISSGSVGTMWLPSPSPLGKHPPRCIRGPCWAWHPLAGHRAGVPR